MSVYCTIYYMTLNYNMLKILNNIPRHWTQNSQYFSTHIPSYVPQVQDLRYSPEHLLKYSRPSFAMLVQTCRIFQVHSAIH